MEPSSLGPGELGGEAPSRFEGLFAELLEQEPVTARGDGPRG